MSLLFNLSTQSVCFVDYMRGIGKKVFFLSSLLILHIIYLQAYFSQDKEHDTPFEDAGSLNKILVKWLDCVDIC